MEEKRKLNKNITRKHKSSRRNYSPFTSLDKLTSATICTKKPVGLNDRRTSVKFNTIRTKRHLSPKLKMTEMPKGESLVRPRKLKTNMSQDFLGVSKKLNK